MLMIPAIAWRNIWRNRTRSLVIILSVTLGLWGGIFIMALSAGVSEQRKQDVIYNYLSHMQLHHPNFGDERQIEDVIPNGMGVWEQIAAQPEVEHTTARTLSIGMANSPNDATGVQIIGIWPESERQVTNIADKIIEGSYFGEEIRNPVVIGAALADQLDIRLRSKVVLTFQDTSNNIVAGAFRVQGIFETASSEFDKGMVYVNAKDMARLMETDPLVHEIAVLVAQEEEQLLPLQSRLQDTYSGLAVETWKELSPELRYLDEAMDYFLYIFIAVILLALAFGLVNTMLMAVLERTRELGMLMAIGMNKGRVFAMIVLETLYLALFGGLMGIGLSVATILFFEDRGIYLPSVEEGMSSYGMSATLYPMLDWSFFPGLVVMVLIFAMVSALYPAYKALKLKPVVAIRKI